MSARRGSLVLPRRTSSQIVFRLTVQPANGLRFCLVARFTRFERSAQRDRALRRKLERVKGIEPSYAAWEAAVLPLNYTRAGDRIRSTLGYRQRLLTRQCRNAYG